MPCGPNWAQFIYYLQAERAVVLACYVWVACTWCHATCTIPLHVVQAYVTCPFRLSRVQDFCPTVCIYTFFQMCAYRAIMSVAELLCLFAFILSITLVV